MDELSNNEIIPDPTNGCLFRTPTNHLKKFIQSNYREKIDEDDKLLRQENKDMYKELDYANKEKILQLCHYLSNTCNIKVSSIQKYLKSILLLCTGEGITHPNEIKSVFKKGIKINLSELSIDSFFWKDCDEQNKIWVNQRKKGTRKNIVKKVKKEPDHIKNRTSSTNNAIAKQMVNKYVEPCTKEDVCNRNKKLNIDENHCYLCDKKLEKEYDIDHFVPSCNTKQKIYGSDTNINKFNSCKSCNSKKSGKTPVETYKWLISEGKKEKAELLLEFYKDNKSKLQCNDIGIKRIDEIHIVANMCHMLLSYLCKLPQYIDFTIIIKSIEFAFETVKTLCMKSETPQDNESEPKKSDDKSNDESSEPKKVKSKKIINSLTHMIIV
jgi:hypothetical protein